MIISCDPSDTLSERVRALGGFSRFAQKLEPFDRVAGVFQQQDPSSHHSHLDVIVQTPISSKLQDMNSHDHSADFVPAPQDERPSTPSKRRSSGVISGTMFSWLVELHSKIWGRNDLKPKLFREVGVTQAHYDELQRRLNEQHPDRGSREYDGEHDVQSVKLDVLRLASSPRRPNINEDRVDDDDAPEASGNDESRMRTDVDEPAPNNDGGSTTTDTIFPCTFDILDLSTLHLRTRGSNRLPLPLLLRQEYKDISELINQRIFGDNQWPTRSG